MKIPPCIIRLSPLTGLGTKALSAAPCSTGTPSSQIRKSSVSPPPGSPSPECSKSPPDCFLESKVPSDLTLSHIEAKLPSG